jgi:hypothetical protein
MSRAFRGMRIRPKPHDFGYIARVTLFVPLASSRADVSAPIRWRPELAGYCGQLSQNAAAGGSADQVAKGRSCSGLWTIGMRVWDRRGSAGIRGAQRRRGLGCWSIVVRPARNRSVTHGRRTARLPRT